MLSEIINNTQLRLKNNKKSKSLDKLKKEVNSLEINKDFPFKKALNEDSLSIIAEVKKASPSKGLIDSDFDYLAIAKEYEKAKVSAISVLTEPYFFKGDNEYLINISRETSIPILRKDFIIDEYMIYESKIIGADAILLIASILDKDSLKNYIEIANKLGLSSLVETHNADEIEKAIDAGSEIIGVNNRDLKTFDVDINTSIHLRKNVPDNIIFVSESGIKDKNDISKLKKYNVDAVLIGETLMRSKDKSKLIKEFKND
ncbi:indole-3-glycerol phosphate synthase TrpC [Methanobrevibacter sp. OttesenSCG-928-K11]|nr:indole-3-glycerol phosphate synthase TrpC [Methanobrevibacter sp. OttesenSCG-928-K11]MDL2270605.1 indole-3-glycerol phosphate synthase TrpC [Methanobrevibacter sp. OttesenSCG-928-I08]